MRATIMHKAGDVRIENVPDAAIQQTDRCRDPRHPRLHLRQRSLAIQRLARTSRSAHGP